VQRWRGLAGHLVGRAPLAPLIDMNE